MIVDGKKIAEDIFAEIQEQIRALSAPPRLTVFTSEPNFETQKFLAVKKRKAEELGVAIQIIELAHDLSTDACVASIQKAAETADGIVVQLPFPGHIDREALIRAIPESHDVDAFNIDDSEILPPVVGAIREIVDRQNIILNDAACVVVGDGRLVGAPAAVWLEKNGARVTRLTKESGDITSETKDADIIVLGAGVPGLLKPDMIKNGVAIFDAGTSEAEGKLVGDADLACAEKAGVFTPVPGGIGPITVAVLLKNLVTLTLRRLADLKR